MLIAESIDGGINRVGFGFFLGLIHFADNLGQLFDADPFSWDNYPMLIPLVSGLL